MGLFLAVPVAWGQARCGIQISPEGGLREAKEDQSKKKKKKKKGRPFLLALPVGQIYSPEKYRPFSVDPESTDLQVL